MEKRTIPVIGMACASCSANVERKLNSLGGVTSASVSLPGRSALVEYDPKTISLQKMKDEINGIGYDLVIEEDRSVTEILRREYVLLRRKVILSWIFAVAVMSVSMGWWHVGSRDVTNQFAMIIALLNMVYCGRQFYVTSWKQLRRGTANMDVLVALSTAIAFLFSTFNTFFGDAVWTSRGIEWHTYFDASVMIITFVLTGRMLEERAKNSTASSIRELMGLAPKTAHSVTADGVTDVPLSTIKVGDIIEVHAGEKVPVDGEVTEANSFMSATGVYIDEAMITGEPTPVLKQKGDNVLAGTILQQGTFRFRAQQIGENTALAHIIRMVQEAQSTRTAYGRQSSDGVRSHSSGNSATYICFVAYHCRMVSHAAGYSFGSECACHCLSVRNGARNAHCTDGMHRESGA